MLPRSKTIVLAISLFLITFRVMSSEIFVESAIERAHHISTYSISVSTQQSHDSKESADDKHHQASSLNLMSHITAHLNEIGFSVLTIPHQATKFCLESDFFPSQNYPDTAFKPPKAIA
jgi:hypothetical protein